MARSDFYNTRKNRFEWKLVILILIIMLIGKGVNKVKEFFTGGNEEDKPTKAAVETVDDMSKDKGNRSISEVQEPEEREDPPASTTVDDTSGTTAGDKSDWYTDPPSVAPSTTGLDGVPIYYEETLSDWEAYIEANGLTYYHEDERTEEDDKKAIDILISVDYENVTTRVGTSIMQYISEYARDNKQYLDSVGLSTRDVLEISGNVLTVLQDPDDYITILDPANPNLMLIIYINSVYETYRMKLTSYEDRNTDAEVTFNESVYMELLDAEVRKAVSEMGQ